MTDPLSELYADIGDRVSLGAGGGEATWVGECIANLREMLRASAAERSIVMVIVATPDVGTTTALAGNFAGDEQEARAIQIALADHVLHLLTSNVPARVAHREQEAE